MTIPTGDKGCPEPGHGTALYDQVFQHFIERCTHMDVAIREWRTIVENKNGIIFSRFLNLLVEVLIFPTREHLGLPAGQVGLHWELRFRQIQGLFVVHTKDT